jgi:hypothetical protein
MADPPPQPSPSRQPRSSPPLGLDPDLVEKWFSPGGVTALVTLATAVVGAIGAVVAVIARYPAPAAVGLSVLSLILATVGVVLFREVPPPPRRMPDLPLPPFAGRPVGRVSEIAEIRRALENERVVAVVADRRGVGSSACASKAVDELGRRCVYLDLRPAQVPMTPDEVLAELATSLGLARDAGAGLVHSALSKGQQLLFLDNADSADQVTALFPAGAERHKVLVAGTARPAGAAQVEVRSLASDAAALLLHATVANPEASPDDQRWRELAELCGRQPRALAAAGDLVGTIYELDGLISALRRIEAVPVHTSSAAIIRMADLDLGPIAEQDVAYAALSLPARRLLRRIAVVPALPDAGPAAALDEDEGEGWPLCPVDVSTMAAVARLRPRRAHAARNALAHAGLLGPPARPHHEHEGGAADQQHEAGEGPEPGQSDDVRAIHPLHATIARLHLLRYGTRRERTLAFTRLLKHLARRAEGHSAAMSEQGRHWFEQNEALLRATVAAPAPTGGGAPEPLPPGARRWWFRLAVALCVWYATEGRLDEWQAVCDTVERLPRRERQLLPSAAVERAWRHNELAAIARRRGDVDAAVGLLETAADAMPDWRHGGEAQIRTNQALVLDQQAQHLRDAQQSRNEGRGRDNGGDGRDTTEAKIADRLKEALGKARDARSLRARSDPIGHALTEHALGVTHHSRGDLADARRHLVRAANLFRAAGELRGEAVALTNLVLVAGEMRSTGIAVSHGKVALDRYDELKARTGRDDVEGRAAALLNLGAVQVTVENPDDDQARQARDWLEESERLRGGRRTRGLGRTLLYLGEAKKELGYEAEAVLVWHRAKAILEELGDPIAVAELDERLGRR